MKEPTLVILAAGMGSRFGGLKQITPVDDYSHSIIDFSLFDAYRAGFRKVAFIIKHEIEDDFKAFIGRRMEKYFDVSYVYQELSRLPEGYEIPSGRVKPWGTGHAVLCAKDAIDGPFAVINADDFYGKTSYEELYNFMASGKADNEHAIVAYMLRNTVTETGHVARGICAEKDGYLSDVVERTHIEKDGEDARFTENGENFYPLSGDSLTSMNCWAFGHGLLDELESHFPAWLDANLPANPEKCEYFLPYVVNAVIKEGTGTVKVLPCKETWYGVTYKEDLQSVKDAIERMRASGLYPKELLE